MRVLITGVGDAFTSRHFGSSALIEAPAGYVLVDCPDLIHRALRAATEAAAWTADASAVGDIILTHLHGDHCNGLESFGFFRRRLRQADPGIPRPRLHVIEPTAARLWERLAPAMDDPWGGRKPSTLDNYFDVRVLTPDGSSKGGAAPAASVAGLSVRCRVTQHVVPTIGLLLSDGARTLGWSGDTAFDEAHIEWLSRADLIVHEAGHGGAHTPIEKLNRLPDGLRAKMRLIHLNDAFDASCTDIRPLREGEVIEL